MSRLLRISVNSKHGSSKDTIILLMLSDASLVIIYVKRTLRRVSSVPAPTINIIIAHPFIATKADSLMIDIY